MNETTTLPSRKKSPSTTMLGNGKPAIQKARHVPATDSSKAHLRIILAKLVRFRDGDFSVRLPGEWDGTDGRIAEAFNQIATQEDRITREVTRLSMAVGKEGRLKQRMSRAGRDRRLGDEGRFVQHAASTIWSGRRPKWRAPSARWPRAISGSRWSWRWTAARSRASSCARRSSSTR